VWCVTVKTEKKKAFFTNVTTVLSRLGLWGTMRERFCSQGNYVATGPDTPETAMPEDNPCLIMIES